MSAETKMKQPVAGVRFTKVGKLYHFDYGAYPDLQPGDYVIVETARGRQMGQIMGFVMPDEDNHDHRPILRPASARDMALKQHWEMQQDEALRICQEIADKNGGFQEAKFVAAQYNYDGSSLTFMMTAEDKLNTNRLQSELNRRFDAQVEIRQVGPRDVAKLLGGYGACGELRCCSTFLTDFSPISIKMAKAQGISLNPTEITGMCGRLRCCLVYEYEQYVAARQHLPKRNKIIGTPFGEGKVIDVHPLQDAVTVLTEEGRHQVQREDIVPLEELRALEKKAKEPCSKHGDEPCDCGKPPGERTADKVAAQQQPEQASTDEKAKPDNESTNAKKDQRRRSRRRRRK